LVAAPPNIAPEEVIKQIVASFENALNKERESVRMLEQGLRDTLTQIRDLEKAIETKSIEIQALCSRVVPVARSNRAKGAVATDSGEPINSESFTQNTVNQTTVVNNSVAAEN
jgi:hypothetical protein